VDIENAFDRVPRDVHTGDLSSKMPSHEVRYQGKLCAVDEWLVSAVMTMYVLICMWMQELWLGQSMVTVTT